MASRGMVDRLWKVSLGALGFLLGFVAGGIVAQLVGLPTPALPIGSDASTV